MTVEIEPVSYSQKSVLRNLLELYLYDMSEYENSDVNEHGLFDYKYLDHYWTEAHRDAFFIRAEGRLAGVVLVRHTLHAHTIAEFFVMRKYRRQGIGCNAAQHVLSLFPGTWRVEQCQNNARAQSFWRTVIAEYTGGQYTELTAQGHECLGTAQEFISR